MDQVIHIEGQGTHRVGTIFGIGRNYAEHAKELGNQIPQGEPVVFLKASSSIRTLSEHCLAYKGETFHFEAELVLRIGKKINLGETVTTLSHIDALALGIDLTRREKQNELKSKGLPWTLAKSFAGSSIVSPFVPIHECFGKTQFQFRFYVNGDLKQSGDTHHMIFDIPTILTFLASSHHLLPGDLIFTGTPAGVGPITLGDRFKLELVDPHRSWDGQL
jgi:2-keto-4-pentenoate hydratase/2-oxohepta-3-ene-1,7-dioic acid hydratase in catechol pathway